LISAIKELFARTCPKSPITSLIITYLTPFYYVCENIWVKTYTMLLKVVRMIQYLRLPKITCYLKYESDDREH